MESKIANWIEPTRDRHFSSLKRSDSAANKKDKAHVNPNNLQLTGSSIQYSKLDSEELMK